MVKAVAVPIMFDEIDIEVPALHFRFALAEHLDGPRTERHRRQSRRAAQALLRTTVNGIDLPIVHGDGNAAQRRDSVNQQQRIKFVTKSAESFERLPGS